MPHFIFDVLHHHFLLPYLGAVLLGEDFLLFLAILSGRNIFPLYNIFIFGFLGAITSDTIIYLIGRFEKIKNLHGKLSSTLLYKKLSGISRSVHGKSDFWPLFSSKFIYGIRWFKIVGYGRKGMPFAKFILYNMCAVALWMIIMIPLGWLAGQGFGFLLHFVKGAEKIVIFVLLALIALYTIEKIARKILAKMSN